MERNTERNWERDRERKERESGIRVVAARLMMMTLKTLLLNIWLRERTADCSPSSLCVSGLAQSQVLCAAATLFRWWMARIIGDGESAEKSSGFVVIEKTRNRGCECRGWNRSERTKRRHAGSCYGSGVEGFGLRKAMDDEWWIRAGTVVNFSLKGRQRDFRSNHYYWIVICHDAMVAKLLVLMTVCKSINR